MKFLGDQDSEAARNHAEDVELPALQDFHAYWLARRGNAPWPPRMALDPLDLKPLLGHITLMDVIRPPAGPQRFRYRLFGTAFVEWFGFDLTGKTIDDWPQPEYRDYLNASYREVVAAGRPFRRYRSVVKDGRLLRYEALMLPLGPPAQIDQVIIAQFFLD